MINRQNWWQLSMTLIGGVVCLPTIMIGQILCQTYGFLSAVISIFIGNIILLSLGLLTARMSLENRKTTVENALEYFGEKGVSFFALIMVISLLGWFAIQLNIMTMSIQELLSLDTSNSLISIAFNVGVGILITLTSLKGIRGIYILTNLSIPIILGILGYALVTLDKQSSNHPSSFSIEGVSLVIALAILLVIDLPTYFRHAQTTKDGLMTVTIIFGIVFPIFEILGAYLASKISGGVIFDGLRSSTNIRWNLIIVLFLLLTVWTSNNLNLYSGMISLSSLFKNYSERKCSLLFGSMGALLSCFNLLRHLEGVLDTIGVLIASFGSVIITRYLIINFNGSNLSTENKLWHFVAWTVGVTAGFSSMLGFTLTAIPLIDATLGAGLGTCLVLIQKKSFKKVLL